MALGLPNPVCLLVGAFPVRFLMDFRNHVAGSVSLKLTLPACSGRRWRLRVGHVGWWSLGLNPDQRSGWQRVMVGSMVRSSAPWQSEVVVRTRGAAGKGPGPVPAGTLPVRSALLASAALL